jgi:hypothetical protein
MKHSSRPAISKGLALALAVILFALGSSGAYGPTMKGAAFGIQLASLLFAFILGAILLAAVTPSYALFCQGLRRRKKLGGAPANFFNDYAGNSLWAVLYAMMAVGFFVLVAHGKGDSMLRLSLVTTLLYFGWLAGAMEYFSLGPNKGRGPLPLATITILWLIVPAFGFMPAASLARFEWWASGLMGTCPFFGIPFLAIQEAARMVGFRNLAPDAAPAPIWAALSVNAVLLIAFQYLAFSARAETAKRVEAQSAP